MSASFLNSEHSKTSDSHRLRVNVVDKMHLRRVDNCVALSNLSIYHTWKDIRKLYRTIALKYQEQLGIKSLTA